MNKFIQKVFLFLLLITTGLNPSFADQKITFYHYDALGSPVATTDEQGEVIWREEYQPWGKKLLNEDATEDNVRGYTGHVHDKETGLTYMQARYYDPEIGRFMGVDPVGFKEDNPIMFNQYAYANNNPYRFTDPNGEEAGSEDGADAYNDALSSQTFGVEGISKFDRQAIESGQVHLGSLAARNFMAAVPDSQYGREQKQFAGVAMAAAAMATRGETSITPNSGMKTFERVVSNAELKATQKTGLLRGGRDGENFFTNKASLDAKRAQQRLGLDGPLRDARIQFKIKNNVQVTGPRRAVPGQTGTVGGGREFSTSGRTEIDILRVDKLR